MMMAQNNSAGAIQRRRIQERSPRSSISSSWFISLSVPRVAASGADSAFLSGEYLVNARGFHLDQLIDRDVLQPDCPHLLHVIGGYAHRLHLHQLVESPLVATQPPPLL